MMDFEDESKNLRDFDVALGGGTKKANLPWSEKYRPQSLDEFESHGFISSSLTKLIQSNNLPHLLLYGPPGTGKTSAILAICNMIYSPAERSNMVLEMNASDDRGISTVRNEILTFASSRTLFGTKHKLLILDEADSMTNDAQNALRRIIEKYTKNVRFCLICNYLSGIIPAIQSRCTRFRFFPLLPDAMGSRLTQIMQSEHVKYDTDGLRSIIRVSNGDMRKALNILQMTYMSHSHINEKNVRACTSYPSTKDITQLLDLLFNYDLKKCYDYLYNCTIVQGITLSDIIKELFLELKNVSLPPTVMCKLIQNMSNIDYNSSTGFNIKLHVAALAASFYNARMDIQLLDN